MKRSFSISLIALALVVGAVGAAPAAHAEDCTLNNGGVACIVNGVNGTCSGDENSGPYCRPSGTSDSTSFSTTAQQNAAAATPSNPNLGGTPSDQFGGVMAWIMSLFAWLAGVAAMTLDWAAYYTVVTMGSYIHDLAAVGVTWRILRDIGNIMLIFGFLSVGITTILNVDWYGFSTKMLPMLLVSAVFLNFSLFLTEAVIDMGNLFATQFVTQINGGEMPTRASLSRLTASNEGISNKIMAQLGFQNIYNPNTNDLVKGSWVVGFMGIILFIVLAFVMFSLAFILIARFVILLFLIIVSPVGWAALAIPKMRKLSDLWWSELFEQTLTAPLLLLALYIALAVITDAQFLTGFNSSSGAWLGFNNNNLPGFISILLSFLVAMGLLFGVVIFSKKLSAFGGDWATKTAGKLSFGAVAFAGRRTAGRFSNYAARRIRSSAIGATETGRLLAGVADRGAKATFDARGIKILGGIKGGLGIEAGEPQKGGYRGREEELVKARTDYAKTLRQSTAQKEATDAAKAAKTNEEFKHAANMRQLEAVEKNLLAVTKANLTAEKAKLAASRRALDAARASGDQVDIRNKQAAYDNDLRAFRDLREREATRLDPIRQRIKAEKSRYVGALAAQDKIIEENKVERQQEAYGKALQEKTVFGVIPRQPYDWPTAVGSARREAAGKILAEAKKDKNQKNMDRLEAILAKADSGGAAPSPAPAAKP